MSKTINDEQLKELGDYADQLKENFDDLDKTNDILKGIHNVLGEKPMFESLEDFDRFMQSDEPLVF